MITYFLNKRVAALAAAVLAAAWVNVAGAQQQKTQFPPLQAPKVVPVRAPVATGVVPPRRASVPPRTAVLRPAVPYGARPPYNSGMPYRAAPYGAPAPYRAAPYGTPAPYQAVPYRAPVPYRGLPARGPVPPAAYAPRSVPPTAYGPRPGYRPPPPYRYYKKKDDDSGPFDRFFKDGRGPDPTRWFKAGDPEEGLAEMWEDLINAPTEWGEYPGGFYAPEIGVPNPIDVEKELRDAPPELMDTLPDIININPPGKSFDDSW